MLLPQVDVQPERLPAGRLLAACLGGSMSSGSAGGAHEPVFHPHPKPSRGKGEEKKERKKKCELSNGLRNYSEIVQLMVLFTLLCKAKQTYSWWLAGLRGFVHTSGLNLNTLYSSSHCGRPPLSCN